MKLNILENGTWEFHSGNLLMARMNEEANNVFAAHIYPWQRNYAVYRGDKLQCVDRIIKIVLRR